MVDAKDHVGMAQDRNAVANIHEVVTTYHNVVAVIEVTNYQKILALVYVALVYMFLAIRWSLVIVIRR